MKRGQMRAVEANGGDNPAAPRVKKKPSVGVALAKELLLFFVCLLLSFPIAGFIQGLRASDAGLAFDADLLDGLAYAVVMAIQTTMALGFVSLGTVEEIGDGDTLDMYPAIFRCALVLYGVTRLGLVLLTYRRRVRRSRLHGRPG